MQKVSELRPVVEAPKDYETIERRIKTAFKRLVYGPLLKAIHEKPAALKNAKKSYLVEALESGRVYMVESSALRGGPELEFAGEFSAEISKELKAQGARWHRSGRFRIPFSKVAPDFYAQVLDAGRRSVTRLLEAAEQLSQKLPADIVTSIRVTDVFESSLFNVEKELKQTMKGLLVAPSLTEEGRQKIAVEWQDNLDKWVSDFAAEEIPKLRKYIEKIAFQGNRYKAVAQAIRRSYGVTERKAKFLARQETGLLMAKFKESRYTESGIHEYRWRCVAGSAKHPVRPSHKVLDGKVFRWDTPPITSASDEPARRNNPGEDFNCRCMAVPIVKF